MQELEVTWGRAARVWWALSWRSAVLGIGLAIGISIIGGAVILIAGLGPEHAAAFDRSVGPPLIALVLGSVIYLAIVRSVLRMKWKTFRIALMPVTDDVAPADAKPENSGS